MEPERTEFEGRAAADAAPHGGAGPTPDGPAGDRAAEDRVAEEAELLAALLAGLAEQARQADAESAAPGGNGGYAAPGWERAVWEGDAATRPDADARRGPGSGAGSSEPPMEPAGTGHTGGSSSGASGADDAPSLADLILVASGLLRGGLGAFSGALARWATAVAAENAATHRQAPPAYRPATRHVIEVRDLAPEPERPTP